MVRRRCSKRWNWRAGVLFGVFAAAGALAIAEPARAGILDFLFGGFHEKPPRPPANVNSYAEPAATPRQLETVRQGSGSTGRYVAFCVRLCDGLHFPIDHVTAATPIETCRAMCPASKTKVFFGSEIDRAVARDGARYADLDTAFVYRQHLVPNCTCNGKDVFGLAPYDQTHDPTLRPGDIVATKNGLMAYTGKGGGENAAFTPVDASTLSAATTVRSPHVRLTRRNAEPPSDADEEPATVVEPQDNERADLRGQVDR